MRLGIAILIFLSAFVWHPVQARDLTNIPCSEVRPTYTRLIQASQRQANDCARSMSAFVPWSSRLRGAGICSWWGPTDCIAPIDRCIELQAAQEQALAICRRKSVVEPAMEGVATKWAKHAMPKVLLGEYSPFKSVASSPSSLSVGDFLRSTRKAHNLLRSGERSLLLATALSGGSEGERAQALFDLGFALAGRAWKPTGNPAAMYSFEILKNIEAGLLVSLSELSTSIALFGVEQTMGRAQGEIAFSLAQSQWASTLAALAANASSREIDTTMTDYVAEFSAIARQIAYAAAKNEERLREAARAREQAEQLARAEAERRTRIDAETSANIRAIIRADQERRAQMQSSPGDGLGPYPPNCRNKRSFDACAIGGRGCSGGNRVRCAPTCRGLCDDP